MPMPTPIAEADDRSRHPMTDFRVGVGPSVFGIGARTSASASVIGISLGIPPRSCRYDRPFGCGYAAPGTAPRKKVSRMALVRGSRDGGVGLREDLVERLGNGPADLYKQ